jgi:UDP-glucuronate 4-epimerase
MTVRRWLVTGGVGFIGYHVSRALLARGDAVRILDDFSDAPYPTAMKRRNAADLRREHAAVEIAEGSVTDPSCVAPLVAGVDGVVHLAGLAGVRPSFADPARYVAVNVEGTATVMALAQATSTAKVFVLASSSSVYGNATPLPAQEDAPAVEPESPYAASKRAAELVALSLSRKTPALRVPALRFFTVYGPRQRPEMAITLFMNRVLKRETIDVFGDGSMSRDFTHVSDITRGVLAALDGAPEGFRPYNLGSGSPVSLAHLVRSIGEAAGVAPETRHVAVPLGDVEATYADISRARAELSWAPEIELTRGLETVRDWVTSAG